MKRTVLFILFFRFSEGYAQVPQGFSLLEQSAKEIVLDQNTAVEIILWAG